MTYSPGGSESEQPLKFVPGKCMIKKSGKKRNFVKRVDAAMAMQKAKELEAEVAEQDLGAEHAPAEIPFAHPWEEFKPLVPPPETELTPKSAEGSKEERVGGCSKCRYSPQGCTECRKEAEMLKDARTFFQGRRRC